MADTTGLLAGTAYVTVDGLTVMVEGSFKYKPTRVKRETLTGMDGVHGYKEKPSAGSISMSLRDSRGTSVIGFNNQTNVTVVAQLANGKPLSGVICGPSMSRKSIPKMRSLMLNGKVFL